MDIMQAIKERHSIRSYTNQKIEGNLKKSLEAFIQQCNQESGLHMQLIIDEPKAFDSFMAHYGKFKNVHNYIALIGKKGDDLEELCGYYGEKIVLYAQMLGLSTCWVAMTYRKINNAFQIDKDEKLCAVIAIGYGNQQGVAHKSKSIDKVMKTDVIPPQWFVDGVEAALLAPTAMNQQKFTFILENGKVKAKAGRGFYNKIDLGIVKYHFEIGANRKEMDW